MEYFMIILIYWEKTTQAVMYPVDNYEHCMELKDSVRNSVAEDTGFRVAVSCPPIQR